MSSKMLFLVDIGNGRCVSHDGYIQLGVFLHSVEMHIELSNTICGDDPIDWQVTYWMPDVWENRYKRVSFQKTEKKNEGSPRTDNATDSRPRDFPDQAETRLNRTL